MQKHPQSGDRMDYHKISRIVCIILFLFIMRLWLIEEQERQEEVPFIENPSVQTSLDYIDSDYKNAFPELYAKGGDALEAVTEIQKTVYLTFDDGPSKNTGKVLDVLKEHGVKATFFVIGKDLTEEGIEYMKRAVAEGHDIGMHTYSHNYKKIYSSVASFLADYDELRKELEEILGFAPNIFRFPGGSYCSYCKNIRKELIEEMTRRGYTYYDWNVSAEDSVGTVTAYSIKKNIFPRVYEVSSPVILMHDSSINCLTAELLPELIEKLQAEGYTFEVLTAREPLHFGE